MKLISLKKRTPGTRHCIKLTTNLLFKNNKLVKNLNKKVKFFGSRCRHTGHITVWQRGGGCKHLFRKINFTNLELQSIVLGVVYDSNRSSFVTLNFDLISKRFFNTSATLHVYPGTLISCQKVINDLYLGYRTELNNIPSGALVNNIAPQSKGVSKYVRSAGAFGQVLQKGKDICTVRLPSNKIYKFSSESYATIGILSNTLHNRVVLGKAGRNRLMGRRPCVRGIAMNPVDHPHGGRTNGGRPSVTPWGIPTKGKPTVKKK